MKKKFRLITKRKSLPQQTEFGTASTQMQKAKNRLSGQTGQQDILSSDGLLPTCSELKYAQFIRISLGKVPQPVNWDKILEEYCDLIKTDKSVSLADLAKKIIYTRWKILFVAAGTKYLKEQYDEAIAARLQEIGYDYISTMEDREAYLKQIYIVEMEAKALIVVLNQLDVEYKLLAPGEEVEASTDITYAKELSILSKFQGYRIDAEQITVTEYAGIINLYLETNKQDNGSSTV